MEIGLGLLHLTPDAFWRMSPRELQAGIDGAGAPFSGARLRPVRRAELSALRARYPDLGPDQGEVHG